MPSARLWTEADMAAALRVLNALSERLVKGPDAFRATERLPPTP